MDRSTSRAIVLIEQPRHTPIEPRASASGVFGRTLQAELVEMQANDFGPGLFVEMAHDRVACHFAEFIE